MSETLVNGKQELIDWAIEKLQSYDNEKKLYNISGVILSILDVICGIVSIFYAGMVVTSVVASIACGAIWSGRFIQLVKTERLAKAIKFVSMTSITYIAARKKRSEYMKSVKNAIKNNPITILFAIIGGTIMGYVGFVCAQKFFVELPFYSYILMAIGCAIISIVFIVILGWDNAKNAVLRAAKKTLSKENYEQLVATVGVLEKKQKAEHEEKAKEAAYQKKVEQAKATVEAYEKAKKLLEENKANKVVAETEQNANINV